MYDIGITSHRRGEITLLLKRHCVIRHYIISLCVVETQTYAETGRCEQMKTAPPVGVS